MAAYGALVSLMNLLDQIQLYHVRNPIFVDQQQIQLKVLREKVVFLQNFLEIHSNGGRSEAEDLETQIVDVVYAAEDLIESHIVDDIHARSASTMERDLSDHFSQELQKVIQDMGSIQKEATLMTEENEGPNDEQPRVSMPAGSSSYVPPPTSKDPHLVTLNNSLMNQIMEKITAKQPDLRIIPITGMGGIGKTTLAQHVYNNPVTKKQFDVHGWITVSQEFNSRESLFNLLCDMNVIGNQNGDEDDKDRDESKKIGYHGLGTMLHKHLSSRRYLIVLDDIWSLEAWDKVKLFLPDNGKGSRVMITTRESDLASNLCPSDTYKMNFLDENESWSLFCRKVFAQRSCPGELEEIGKRIVKTCKGLPLAIVAIGGVLAKSMQQKYWKNIVKDISAGMNLKRDEPSHVRILYTSYTHLPIQLKPCFLYFAVFPEDHSIRASKLKMLWVAEGFLKPKEGKILEDVADDCLKDLIGRNLINVDRFGSTGNVTYCKIHDLLRDLCLREAQKQRFLYAIRVNEGSPLISQGIDRHRKIVLHSSKPTGVHSPQLRHALKAASYTRSFICNFGFYSKPPFDVKLLRVWNVIGIRCSEVLSELVNSRYLGVEYGYEISESPSSISRLWNLQTLTNVGCVANVTLPSEIWEMPQLRHVKIEKFELGDPNCGVLTDVVLENLQTLATVLNFNCSEQVLEKIPNLRRLKVVYGNSRLSPDCFRNLGRLTKLESLHCLFKCVLSRSIRSNLEFPQSLKKLTLGHENIKWNNIVEKIGTLPHLEKLKLYQICKMRRPVRGKQPNWVTTQDWNSVEEHFIRLKFLQIAIRSLKNWTAESGHFPCLEHLVLLKMVNLEEVPSEIGDIPSLQSIYLDGCSKSAAKSVERILEEQRSFDNLYLVVTIK